MASNWRLNVAYQGWSLSPFRLIARFVGGPFGNKYLAAADETFPGVYFISVQDTGFLSEWSAFNIPAENPRFPYGWTVTPDRPVVPR